MSRRHILLFGNGREINDVDFDSLEFTRAGRDNIVTAGVNRIWRKYVPDYFFFIDGDIVRELLSHGVTRPEGSRWFSSDYLFQVETIGGPQTENEKGEFVNYFDNNHIELLPRPIQFTKRTNSLLWSIIYLNDYLFFKETCVFYLFATPLKAQPGENHHFWGRDDGVIYHQAPEKMNAYFSSHARGLQELVRQKYQIYSATDNSIINEFLGKVESNPSELVEELDT